MTNESYATGMQPHDRERELFHSQLTSLSLLKCVFNQNLLIMERLGLGSLEGLQAQWLAEFESLQAQQIADWLKKYPPTAGT